MCVPRLSKSFCCCSLGSGFFLVCLFGMVWNAAGTQFPEMPRPPFLDFIFGKLRERNWFSEHKLKELKTMYYLSQGFIYCFAIIGIYWETAGFLYLLIFSDTIILLIYILLMTSNVVFDEKNAPVFIAALYLALNYYEYAITISFYYELSHGPNEEDQSGVINNEREMIFSPSAPNHTDLMSHPAQSVEIPDPGQTVISEIQPLSVEDCSISLMTQNSDDPPPYHTVSEKPPPYNSLTFF